MSSNIAKSLIGAAKNEGSLSPLAVNVLNAVPDIGARIEEALGVPALDIAASEVVLVSLLIDDSGSISSAGNEDLVREGHNAIIDALAESKAADSILVHARYLNGTVLYPFRPVKEALRMDSSNYRADGGTPLYDESIIMLGTVMAKYQEFMNEGVAVRTITVIVTDGHDQHSRRLAADVSRIAVDMLASEDHIVAGVGIDDRRTDFRSVFGDMGIRDEWILTPANSHKEIRAAFRLVSRSAVRASQNASAFAAASMGGFGS